MAIVEKIIGTLPVVRGEYSEEEFYYKDNIVQHENMSYQLVVDGPVQGVSPTDRIKWRIFAGIPVVQTEGDAIDRVMSQKAVTDTYGHNTECPEYVRIIEDAEGKFLFGIKANGNVEWAKGIPTPVMRELELLSHRISSLLVGDTSSENIDSLNKVLSLLSGISTTDATLLEQLQTINAQLESLENTSCELIESEEYVYLVKDAEDNVVAGIKTDGTFTWSKGIPYHILEQITRTFIEINKTNAHLSEVEEDVQSSAEQIENINSILKDRDIPEYIYTLEDAEGKLVFGIRKDGSIYFPRNEMFSVEESEEYAYLVKDAENKILFAIKRTGEVINPPQPSIGNTSVQKYRDTVKDVYEIVTTLRSHGFNSETETAIRNLVFNNLVDGIPALPAIREIPMEGVMLSWQDDDSIDNFLRYKSGRGFFSTLYPVLASVGMVGSEAVEGWRIGLIDNHGEPIDLDTTLSPRRDVVARVIKDLVHMKGWEAIGHTMTARFGSEYLVNDLEELSDLELTPSDNIGKSTEFNCAYVQPEGKHYYLSTEGWKELPFHWLQPFLKNHSGSLIAYNPDYSYDYQVVEYKKALEDKLGITLRSYQPPASSWSPRFTQAILDSGVENVWNFKSVVPQVNDKTNVGVAYRHSASLDEGNNVGSGRVYNYIVNTALADIAAGSKHVSFYGHAYTAGWSNKIASELVSNGGTYPDSWVTPVKHPEDFPGNYFDPHPDTGLTSWKEWHPCPGTQLYEVWSALKYLIEEVGLIPTTASGGQARLQPKVRVGFKDKYGQIYSRTLDNQVRPFYSERLDGSVEAFNN